jgi:hypothetical protein
LKPFAFGSSRSSTAKSTACYVSWNGATEVRYWNFYTNTTDADDEHADYKLIGSVAKTGFETMFVVDGYVRHVMVEGVSRLGESLGNSTLETTVVPPQWSTTTGGGGGGSSADSSEDLDSLSAATLANLVPVQDLKAEARSHHPAVRLIPQLVALQKSARRFRAIMHVLVVVVSILATMLLLTCCVGAGGLASWFLSGRSPGGHRRRGRATTDEEGRAPASKLSPFVGRKTGYEPVLEKDDDDDVNDDSPRVVGDEESDGGELARLKPAS